MYVLPGPTTPELSRMFPTPPSLENQQNALSPAQTADIMATDIVMCAMPSTVMTDVDTARTEAFNGAVKPGQTEVRLLAVVLSPFDSHVKLIITCLSWWSLF